MLLGLLAFIFFGLPPLWVCLFLLQAVESTLAHQKLPSKAHSVFPCLTLANETHLQQTLRKKGAVIKVNLISSGGDCPLLSLVWPRWFPSVRARNVGATLHHQGWDLDIDFHGADPVLLWDVEVHVVTKAFPRKTNLDEKNHKRRLFVIFPNKKREDPKVHLQSWDSKTLILAEPEKARSAIFQAIIDLACDFDGAETTTIFQTFLKLYHVPESINDSDNRDKLLSRAVDFGRPFFSDRLQRKKDPYFLNEHQPNFCYVELFAKSSKIPVPSNQEDLIRVAHYCCVHFNNSEFLPQLLIRCFQADPELPSILLPRFLENLLTSSALEKLKKLFFEHKADINSPAMRSLILHSPPKMEIMNWLLKAGFDANKIPERRDGECDGYLQRAIQAENIDLVTLYAIFFLSHTVTTHIVTPFPRSSPSLWLL